MRFYDPRGSVVRLDGRDIREYAPAWVRRQIGVVSQEPVLFSSSIHENVTYSKPEATTKEIERVLRMSHIWDKLQSVAFPEKLLTEVGEVHCVRIPGNRSVRASA